MLKTSFLLEREEPLGDDAVMVDLAVATLAHSVRLVEGLVIVMELGSHPANPDIRRVLAWEDSHSVIILIDLNISEAKRRRNLLRVSDKGEAVIFGSRAVGELLQGNLQKDNVSLTRGRKTRGR